MVAKARHPAVVAPGQRQLDLGLARQRAEEDRRVEDLDIDLELVHVAQPGLDVVHFA